MRRVIAAQARSFELTSQQERLMLVPETLCVANFGGRAGGKTRGAIYVAVRHIQEHGPLARVWIIRKTFPGLLDVERELRQILPELFPGCSWNGQKHEWAFANGAVIELGVLDSEASFARWQGRTATLIIVDESQQFSDPSLVDLLHTCLRAPEGVPTRMILCANPGVVECGPYTLAADPPSIISTRWPSTGIANSPSPGRHFRQEPSGQHAGTSTYPRPYNSISDAFTVCSPGPQSGTCSGSMAATSSGRTITSNSISFVTSWVRRKSAPIQGRSASNGMPLVCVSVRSWMRPAKASVCPARISTAVSTQRFRRPPRRRLRTLLCPQSVRPSSARPE